MHVSQGRTTLEAAIKAPEFQGTITWLNGEPMTMEELRGNVVLVYFWDYTNLGCLDALPYVKEWREKYHRLGLRIVGVHTPEYSFGRSAVAVRNAVVALGIKDPILLDNEFEVWNAYNNRTWPGFFVVNTEGNIVYSDVGECAFGNIEAVIHDLLGNEKGKKNLPELTGAIFPRDEVGIPVWDPTPIVRTGYEGENIGNEEGFEPHRVVSYEIPPKKMEEGKFYLHGKWLNHRFSVAVAKAHDGPEASLEIPYTAQEVNVVIHPQGDIGFSVNLEIDGQPLTKTNSGENVRLTGRGTSRASILVVSDAKMYRIVKHDKMQSGVLKMSSRSGGLAVYCFSFAGSTCPDGQKQVPAIKSLMANRAKAKTSIVALSRVYEKEALLLEKEAEKEAAKLKKETAKLKREAAKAAKAEGAAAKKASKAAPKETAPAEAAPKAAPKKTTTKAAKKDAPKAAKKVAPKAAAKKVAPKAEKKDAPKAAKKVAPKAAKKDAPKAAKKVAPKAAKKDAPKAAKKVAPKAAKKDAPKAAAKKAPAKKTQKGVSTANADDSGMEMLRTRAGKRPTRKSKK